MILSVLRIKSVYERHDRDRKKERCHFRNQQVCSECNEYVGGSIMVAGVILVKAEVRTRPRRGTGRVEILNRKGNNAGKVMEIGKKSWGKKFTIRETEEAC